MQIVHNILCCESFYILHPNGFRCFGSMRLLKSHRLNPAIKRIQNHFSD